MAMSVDRIHQQHKKENVADIDLDEESKEFQKLSLNDVPHEVPKIGKPLEQKAAGDFLYQDITKCLAPYDNFSPCLNYYNSLPKGVLIHDEKSDKSSPSTYSPLNPPDWLDKWDYKDPSDEEYARLKSLFEARAMSSVIP